MGLFWVDAYYVKTTEGQDMAETSDFAAFDGKKYLNLETFRVSGSGVRTPVWFAAGDGSLLYVYSTADSGKAKRIRRSGLVRIAPCDARGRLTGGWINAMASMVNGAEYDSGMALLNRKYRPWKQLMDLGVRLYPRHERVMFALRPRG
jgi:uncharacterized protein